MIASLLIFISLLVSASLVYGDVGIITAITKDTDSLRRCLINGKKIHKANRDFFKGMLNGKQIIICRSPMGKINNAITAQLLISEFHVEKVFSLGFAGALSASVKTHDILVADKIFQHDIGVEKPYGFVGEDKLGRRTDTELTERLMQKLAIVDKLKAFRGDLVSGDQFIASTEKKNQLYKRYGALAVDTNSAAIIQVCEANEIRCAIIRIISDEADVMARTRFEQSVRQSDNSRLISALLEVAGE